ncbi:MAG: MBL fold metallo-hydrolase [Planctomycetota bacterium]
MKVEFWGAARTVTGSMHLIHYRGKRILLDCGLYQGKRKLAFERNRNLPFDASSIDIVILSHAHIDHSGNLPSLTRAGFRGHIYSTSATRDLAAFMLLDSAKIQVNDVKYVNKRRKKKKQKPFEPLYIPDDAVATLKRFRTVEYYDEFDVMEGVRCKFHSASHMLGAAVIELNFDGEKEGDEPCKLVFSGDVGRPGMPILRDADSIADVDYLIMEATYGSRIHPEAGDIDKTIEEAARETFESGGKLIIPAFSVGRTQEIIYRLNLLFESGKLAPIKVFIDSPLAVNATEIFREHVECFDDEMVEAMISEEDKDPLAFDNLFYVRKVEHSKALNNFKEPAIIISASGMCEAGRILHHLKNNIEKPNTTIMFAGYQAPHTLGRILLDQQRDVVRIFGQEYKVNAGVCRLEGSSGHADQKELLDWAGSISKQSDLKKVALVHCELDSAEELKRHMGEQGIGPVVIPDRGESMILG